MYHRALDATVALEGIASDVPSTRGDLRLQLRRASASILLNIAEGAGEFSAPEKRGSTGWPGAP
jgi:four helix bundle protein